MTEQKAPPILFASVSHPGLFNPLAGIASELSRRGIEGMWFASTDDRKADVEAMGPGSRIGFVPLGPYLPELQPGRWSEETFRKLNSRSRLRAFGSLMDLDISGQTNPDFYQYALDAVDRVKPGLIVVDNSTMWMLDAATTRGIPYILNSPVLVCCLYPQAVGWSYPSAFSGLPFPMTLRQKLANALFSVARFGLFLRPRRAKATWQFVRRRKKMGLANPTNLMSRRGDEALAIIGHSLAGIDYPFDWAPAHLHMVGAVLPPPAAAGQSEVMDWVDAHESVVYIGLGSMNRMSGEQIGAILTAIERLGPSHHVLWSLPESQNHHLPETLPANVRIENWVPQTDVLAHPHVRVFMSQGGAGTHQGLYFGKPLLLVPHIWEMRDMSARFVSSGAALQLDDTRTIDPGEVTSKLQRLLTEEQFHERAGYWQQRYREAGGASAAADIVLRHRGARPGTPG